MPSLIGNKPNQVPTNGDLGTLAFEDHDNVLITGGAISGNIATTGLNFDSNTLVIDATNNRVGVGISNPADTLQVNGGVTIGSDTNTTQRSRIFESFGLNIESGTAGGGRAIIFGTNNTERMRITSAGNVGIGTSSPQNQSGFGALTLNGSTGGALFLTTGNTRTGQFYNTSTEVAVGSVTAIPLNFYTNNTNRMSLDSSGNLGLGVTPSVWVSTWRAFDFGLGGAVYSNGVNNAAIAANAYNIDGSGGWRYKGSGNANLFQTSGGQFLWYNAPSGTAGNAITFTQAMTLDASGNLLVGTTTSRGKITVVDTNYNFSLRNDEANYVVPTSRGASTTIGGFIFKGIRDSDGGEAERMRIDTSGNLLVGSTSYTYRLAVTTGAADWVQSTQNTNASLPYGNRVFFAAASPNNTGSQFVYCVDSGSTTRFEVRSNGGIGNYSGNNVNLSDAREKTNVELAGSYLNKICSIPVKTFNYIDQNRDEDDGLTLGVIAQDVQAVAPEFVMESNWGTQEEPKMRLSIYQTDLQYALMKCIQEQQAIINDLKARIETLESK